CIMLPCKKSRIPKLPNNAMAALLSKMPSGRKHKSIACMGTNAKRKGSPFSTLCQNTCSQCFHFSFMLPPPLKRQITVRHNRVTDFLKAIRIVVFSCFCGKLLLFRDHFRCPLLLFLLVFPAAHL